MQISLGDWFFLAFAVALALGACSSHDRPKQISDCQGPANTCLNSNVGSGSGSGAGGGGNGGQCGSLDFGGTCQVCMEKNCCSIMTRCSDSANCLTLVRCMEACQTQACVSDCAVKNPNGVADLDGVFECSNATCKADCTPTDAGVDAPKACTQIVSPSAACERCLGANCCSEAETCSADPACMAYRQCLVTCPPNDAACISNCQTTFPQGFTSHTALGKCAQTACNADCS